MKRVSIDDVIGQDFWTGGGITQKSIKEQLDGLSAGEEIEVTINSPGGAVYEGIAIFNLLREYAKAHPMTVRISGIAASMASYIALAPRTINRDSKITVSDNSVVLIHNPYTITRGDYRDLQKEAEYLERLAGVYAQAHAFVSGKDENEIRKAMDDEAFYVGQEIIVMGFANDFDAITQSDQESEVKTARDTLIVNARAAVERAIEREYSERNKNDLEKAVALFDHNIFKPPAAQGSKLGEKITVNLGGGSMTPEELLAKDKSCYDAVFALGEKAGLEKERARVNAHLLLGEKTGSLAIAAKHIKSGVSTGDETAQAEYYAAKLDAVRLGDRDADNVGDLHTEEGAGTGAAPGGGGGADDAKLAAAFAAGYAGKDVRGKSWAE